MTPTFENDAHRAATEVRGAPGADLLRDIDPDLANIYGAFAEEVAAVGPREGVTDLPARTVALVRLAAAVAVGGPSMARAVVAQALDTDTLTPVEVLEVVVQAVPYVGAAAVLDIAVAVRDELTDHGVRLPLPTRAVVTPQDRAVRGRAVQEEIVGAAAVASMYASAPADEQHVQRFLSAHCFGDHYTREGLDLPTRELLTFSLLTALGGAEPQVRGHAAASLNVGHDRGTLLAVVTQLLPYIGYPRTLNAMRAVDEVAPPTAQA
jgi:4-carboxymuconolactone decarboxylase